MWKIKTDVIEIVCGGEIEISATKHISLSSGSDDILEYKYKSIYYLLVAVFSVL